MSYAKPLRLAALAFATVVGVRAHYKVLLAKRKRASRQAGSMSLENLHKEAGLDPKTVAFYSAIDRHTAFSRDGAHRAFAHLGQEEHA